MNRPVCRKRIAKYANFLGIIVQKGDLAPIAYTNWRAMPLNLKEKIWEIVLVCHIFSIFNIIYILFQITFIFVILYVVDRSKLT